jgi:hypothetical protein
LRRAMSFSVWVLTRFRIGTLHGNSIETTGAGINRLTYRARIRWNLLLLERLDEEEQACLRTNALRFRWHDMKAFFVSQETGSLPVASKQKLCC